MSRFQYPSVIRIIRVMCSGRVDPAHVVWALASEFDAVLVIGCRIGDCHYSTGNLAARRRMRLLQAFMKKNGLQPERLRAEWISSAEASKFSKLVEEYGSQVKALGPARRDDSARLRLLAMKRALEDEKIRWLIGNEKKLVEDGNVFGNKLEQDRFDEAVFAAFEDEFNKNLIAVALEKAPASVPELAALAGLKEPVVGAYLVALEQAGKIAPVAGHDEFAKYAKI